MNWYAYVGNNPLKWTDPTGMYGFNGGYSGYNYSTGESVDNGWNSTTGSYDDDDESSVGTPGGGTAQPPVQPPSDPMGMNEKTTLNDAANHIKKEVPKPKMWLYVYQYGYSYTNWNMNPPRSIDEIMGRSTNSYETESDAINARSDHIDFLTGEGKFIGGTNPNNENEESGNTVIGDESVWIRRVVPESHEEEAWVAVYDRTWTDEQGRECMSYDYYSFHIFGPVIPVY